MFSQRDPKEMNCRQARALAQELRAKDASLRVEVWALAQGVARVQVEQQLPVGVLRVILKNRPEAVQLFGLPEEIAARRIDA
jgi:hypothetical protein